MNLPTHKKGRQKGSPDWSGITLKSLIDESGEIIFQEITAVLNFLFEYKNVNYEALTVEWVEDNMSIRILKEILLEVAHQNEMAWLPPFFLSKFRDILMM